MTQNILVIDDDAAVRGSFQRVLGEIGCAVRVAADGLQGLAMAKAERPDLIFLELFPLDVLKIDKRFIDDIPTQRDDMEIVTAIIAMAHSLRLKVLAEGAANKEQLAYLKTQGCDQFQGYLTSRPVPAAEFEKLLQGQ